MRSRLAAALAAAVALAGCPEPPDGPRYDGAGRSEPHYGGTFVFHHESAVRGLDPQVAYDELSSMGVRLLFDGLLDYDEDAQLVPSLAKSMPEVSEDGETFRFELREGVKFHNGRELTAEDVRWSMERMLSPEVGSPGHTFYSNIAGVEAFREGEADHIEGIEVTGRYGIAFRLTKPDQTFLNAMAMTFAYPVAKDNYGPGQDPNTEPIGTGPFELDSWEHGVRLVFRKNESYWKPGEPYVDRMIYLENINRDVAVMRFRNGDIDHEHRFAPADFIFFSQSDKWQPYVMSKPKLVIWGLAMNCEMEPFDDVHVRRAVAHAVDRERWARSRNYRLRPAGQAIPPGLMGFDEDLEEKQHLDLEKARAELRKAGYEDGRLDIQVELWLGKMPTARFYGELAQADLKKIGLDVRIKQVAFPVYLQETGKPRTARMLLAGWYADFPDPANFFDILFHSRSIQPRDSHNRAFYSHPDLDALLDRARVETDPDEREKLYLRASNFVAREAPWAFVFNEIQFEARQPYVRNYRLHPVWHTEYRSVWLDTPRKRIARSGTTAPFERLAEVFRPFGGLR